MEDSVEKLTLGGVCSLLPADLQSAGGARRIANPPRALSIGTALLFFNRVMETRPTKQNDAEGAIHAVWWLPGTMIESRPTRLTFTKTTLY